ncbi:MAG: hypothetical protein K1X64_04275 [Myxococcaceae bacterium]|nr:hypothetical protein [Myxococcaceae bacterium]
MRRFLRNNGLTLTLLALFAASLAGHAVSGWLNQRQERQLHGKPAQTFRAYLCSSDFGETVFENWESEFLQMGMYLALTALLFQKGSAESRDPEQKDNADSPPQPYVLKDSTPWAVRRGGLWLALYSHSLSLAFIGLFALSFTLHAITGTHAYNDWLGAHGEASRVTVLRYLRTSRFWLESFQNWQSEFLSIAAMVWLSIYLRQRGSPESKDVAAAHSHTGAS